MVLVHEDHQITTTGGRMGQVIDLREQLCCGWRLGLAAVGEAAGWWLTTQGQHSGATSVRRSVRNGFRKSVFQIVVIIGQSSGVWEYGVQRVYPSAG